ncbi:MAG: hypothetical protein DLM72_19475 [Candidatus Nitrosopolaris wilkensis]|nr:MAG: hypothetical protein DLM72_19475 [Candidatus Nitrosopolaris wilkensis]
MRRKTTASFLSIILGMILSLSTISSGIGVAKADSVIATIPLSPPHTDFAFPFRVAFDSANGDVYVTDFASRTVSVIDGSTNKVIANITVGDRPLGVAFDSANGDVYVANSGSGSDTVSVIDGSTNQVIGTIPIGGPQAGPSEVAFDSANGNLYVTSGNAVSVIDGSTNTVIGSPIPLGSAPSGIAFDSANGNLYVTNGTVSVIDGSTNKVIGNIVVDTVGGPLGVAFDSANGNVYVANSGTGTSSETVSVIDGSTNKVIGTIPVNGPQEVAFDSANGDIYVTASTNTDHIVYKIDGSINKVVGTILVGDCPEGLAFDSANNDLYVANTCANTVSVIATEPSHSTTLTLNTIANVPSGTKITVTGKLTDNAGAGVAGKSITFTGNGAGNLISVITNPDGTFSATGISPNTVATGWTVQAHFAGDSVYAPADSGVQSYNTVRTTPIPPDTTITQAADGNGVTIANVSTTFSSSIRFTFTATAGTNPVASFECNLDNRAFSPCSSPNTLTNLAVGKHTFQVRAVDTSGNKDPTPASFSWTISAVTPPSNTTITSAVDGNGATISNAGTTLSTSIKIAFSATPGTNPISGFQCSLDNSAFSRCSSPATFTNLAVGPHKFTVVAVDTAGNKDPNPATFGWTVRTLTAAQAIQQLIQLKHNMHLDPATDRTLDIRLNIALQFAQNNIKSGTCIQLTVFIKQVQGSDGHVTSTQATQLIQGAQNIEAALGCTITSSGIVASPSAQSSFNSTQSQHQPQTSASSPLLLQPKSPYTSQIPQLQPSQAQHAAPIANAGISQTVNENTKVTLDGRTSYTPNGGTIVAYQWTQLPSGAPVILTGTNTATPLFTAPVVPTDTVLAFSLKALNNHGTVSTNPAIVYIMVKHNPNIGATPGGNTPGTTIIQSQHRPLVPNNLLPTPSQPNPRPPQIGSFQP